MQHMGVRYELMQTTNPSGWKWIAHLANVSQPVSPPQGTSLFTGKAGWRRRCPTSRQRSRSAFAGERPYPDIVHDAIMTTQVAAMRGHDLAAEVTPI
jgi:hypothetical protein